MHAATNIGLMHEGLQGWYEYYKEQKQIKEFMKSHSENAQGLLNNMHAATNTGLLHEVITAWAEYWKEQKQINEFAEMMNGANGKLAGFGDRNKKGAKSVMERAH